MANEIKSLFGAVTPMTITLASLASSTLNVGRQSTMVDNSSTRFSKIKVAVKVKQGTSPVANRSIYIYIIRGDGTLTDDSAGASDAAFTAKNTDLLGCIQNGTSVATGDVLTKTFEINEPGRSWGIAIAQDTGVALDATPGNHLVEYYGINPEVQ